MTSNIRNHFEHVILKPQAEPNLPPKINIEYQLLEIEDNSPISHLKAKAQELKLNEKTINFGSEEIDVESLMNGWHHHSSGLTFHIDKKKATLTIFQPTCNSSDYFCDIERDGQIIPYKSSLIAKSYKIKNLSRIDKESLEKFNKSKYEQAASAEEVLIRYLNAEPLQTPPPTKAPHLYTKPFEQNEQLLQIALSLQGIRKSETIALRVECFSLHAELLKSNRCEDKIKKLVEIASDLKERNAISEEELSTIMITIHKSNQQAPSEQILHNFREARIPEDVARPKQIDTPLKPIKNKDRSAHSNIENQTASNIKAKPTKKASLSQIAEWMKDPNTLTQGLKQIHDWYMNDEDRVFLIPSPFDPIWKQAKKELSTEKLRELKNSLYEISKAASSREKGFWYRNPNETLIGITLARTAIALLTTDSLDLRQHLKPFIEEVALGLTIHDVHYSTHVEMILKNYFETDQIMEIMNELNSLKSELHLRGARNIEVDTIKTIRSNLSKALSSEFNNHPNLRKEGQRIFYILQIKAQLPGIISTIKEQIADPSLLKNNKELSEEWEKESREKKSDRPFNEWMVEKLQNQLNTRWKDLLNSDNKENILAIFQKMMEQCGLRADDLLQLHDPSDEESAHAFLCARDIKTIGNENLKAILNHSSTAYSLAHNYYNKSTQVVIDDLEKCPSLKRITPNDLVDKPLSLEDLQYPIQRHPDPPINQILEGKGFNLDADFIKTIFCQEYDKLIKAFGAIYRDPEILDEHGKFSKEKELEEAIFSPLQISHLTLLKDASGTPLIDILLKSMSKKIEEWLTLNQSKESQKAQTMASAAQRLAFMGMEISAIAYPSATDRDKFGFETIHRKLCIDLDRGSAMEDHLEHIYTRGIPFSEDDWALYGLKVFDLTDNVFLVTPDEQMHAFNNAIELYFKTKNLEVPKGLSIQREEKSDNFILNFQDNTEILNQRFFLRVLNRLFSNDQKYLENETIKASLKKIFNSNIESLSQSIKRQDGYYHIEGSDFKFDIDGNFYFKNSRFLPEKSLPNVFKNEGQLLFQSADYPEEFLVLEDLKPKYFFNEKSNTLVSLDRSKTAHADQEFIYWIDHESGTKTAERATPPSLKFNIINKKYELQGRNGFFLTDDPILVGKQKIEPPRDAVIVQNSKGEKICIWQHEGTTIEVSFYENKVIGDPWALMDFCLKTNQLDLIRKWKHKIVLSPPSNHFQISVANRLKESICHCCNQKNMDSLKPDMMAHFLICASIDFEISGNGATLLQNDSTFFFQACKVYEMYLNEIASGSIPPVPKEAERLFIVQLNQWIKKHTTPQKGPGFIARQLIKKDLLIPKQPETDENSNKSPKKLTAAMRFILFLNKIAGPQISKEEETFRSEFKELFEPLIEKREKNLTKIIKPKTGISIKREDQKIATENDKEFDFFHELTNPNSDPEKNLLELYKTARGSASQEKEELMQRLELKEKQEDQDIWILEVCKHPQRYPSYEKLSKAIDEYNKLVSRPHNENGQNSEKLEKTLENKIKKELFNPINKIFKKSHKNASANSKKIYFSKIRKPLTIRSISVLREFETIKRPLPAIDFKTRLEEIDGDFDTFFKKLHADLFIQPKGDEPSSPPLIQSNDSLQTAKSLLQASKDQIQEELINRQEKLLQRANRCINESEQLQRERLSRNLDWEGFVSLMAKGQEYAMMKHIGSANEIDALRRDFYECLAIQSRFLQMERIYKSLEGINDADADPHLLQTLSNQLKETRTGRENEKLDTLLLFFEAVSPKGLYRKDQYEKLTIEDSRQSAELPTGAGKTDYIIAILNQMAAKAPRIKNALKKPKAVVKNTTSLIHNLVINIWPSSLVEANKQEINIKTEAALGKNVFRFSFSRDQKLDEIQLEALVKKLQRFAKKGISISVRAEDLASINLMFIETLYTLSNHKKAGTTPPESLTASAMHLRTLLEILNCSSFTTIDESQLTLDPTQRTIYALNNPKLCPESSLNFAITMFALLEKHSESFKTIVLENRLLSPEEKKGLIDTIFNEEVLSALATYLNLDANEAKKLLPFLKGEGDPPKTNEKDEDNLYLAKGYYASILEAGLNPVNLSYGLSKMHLETHKYAIPYQKRDVPKETADASTPSSYQNLDETIFKTIRTYYYNGLSKENILDLLEKLPDHSREILLKDLGISFQIKTRNPALLRNLISPYLSEKPFMNRLWIDKFMKTVVLPTIRHYPTSIGITPQDLLLSLHSSYSLSATPVDTRAHSLTTKFLATEGAQKEQLDRINNKIQSIKKIPDSERFCDSIKSACEERKVRALADPSGLRSLDFTFVKTLAKSLENSSIHYILYFNEKGERLIYHIESKTSSNFNPNAHANHMDETLTLYDQAHSTGTDIAQSPNASLILLSGKASTATEIMQGAGRMRRLKDNQTLEVWTEGDKDLSKQDLFNQWIANNDESAKFKNRLAVEQLMQAEIKSEAIRTILGIDHENGRRMPSVDTMVSMFSKYEEVLVQTSNYNPKQAYGQIGQLTEVKELLDQKLEFLKGQANKLFPKDQAQKLKNKLDEYAETWKGENPLPMEEKALKLSMGDSQEVAANQQQENEQQMRLNLELTPIVSPTETVAWDQSIHSWKKDDIDKIDRSPYNPKKRRSEELQLFSLPEVMASSIEAGSSYEKAKNLFDKNLLISSNFLSAEGGLKKAWLHAKNRKPVDQILISEKEGQYFATIVDASDQAQLHRILSESQGSSMLYSLELDIPTEVANGCDKNLLQNPNVQLLIAEAKLFGGIQQYSREEQQALQAKISMDPDLEWVAVSLLRQLDISRDKNQTEVIEYYQRLGRV